MLKTKLIYSIHNVRVKVSLKTKLLLFLFLSSIFTLLLFWLLHHYVPQRYNPFTALDIQDTPTFITKYKIIKLQNNPEACFEVLANSELKYELMNDRETGKHCGFFSAAVLNQSGISYGGDITLTCPAFVSLAMWESHHLQQLANEHFEQKIQRVRHYGTYACRNINSTKKGRRSEHAVANAIDIAGFLLEDGTEISVLKHWNSDSKKGEFIREVHSAACDYFKTVLGPEYNDLHQDHFHFDMGSSLVCK